MGGNQSVSELPGPSIWNFWRKRQMPWFGQKQSASKAEEEYKRAQREQFYRTTDYGHKGRFAVYNTGAHQIEHDWSYRTQQEYEDIMDVLAEEYAPLVVDQEWDRLAYNYLMAEELLLLVEEGILHIHGEPTQVFEDYLDEAMDRLYAKKQQAQRALDIYSKQRLGHVEETGAWYNPSTWEWPFGKKANAQPKEESLNDWRKRNNISPDLIADNNPRLKKGDDILRKFVRDNGYDRPREIRFPDVNVKANIDLFKNR